MEERPCFRAHVNQLWSIWYGLAVTALQAYIAFNSAKRLLEWFEYSWENEDGNEIEASLILTGIAILLLPIFLAASVFKVGNWANDGYKLGRHLSTCSNDITVSASTGFRAVWKHGGPTAPFLHLVSAFCLLLPNLLIQGKLIEEDLLPKEDVWKTDLDFLISSYDRTVGLLPTSSVENNSTKTTPVPVSSTTPIAQGFLIFAGQDGQKIGPVTIEFFNYALALAVYAVRYPAVYWNTNKCWGAIFSFQLFINGIQNLFVYAGVCILYKVHVVGPSEVLKTLPLKFGNHFFLLNSRVTLALLILTSCLVLSSSLVLYLYGYGRYSAFLSHEKACKVISVEGREWGYLTHCAALCVLLAITVVEGPLLVDLAVIYKSTLDSLVLFSVIAAVFHLFIWVVLWLILTIKQNWVFKLRVTVGKAAVKSARSIKLLTDVELLSSCEASAPLLVVASGRTYTVCDTSPKKTIINVIHKTAMERKARMQEMNPGNNKDQFEDEEQIYWLRPKPLSPKNSPDSEISDQISWQRKAIQKPKVTFDQSAITHKDDGDDGDYARLRELPISNSKSAIAMQDDIYLKTSALNKVQYASTECKGLVPACGDYEDPSPLITPEPSEIPMPPSSDTPATPRCLLRADSGMPHDLTPRSDSEISGSPPDHSETSSGVHSNSSRESHNTGNQSGQQKAEINQNEKQTNQHWNNGILQREINPQDTGEVVICRRVENENIAAQNNLQDKFGRSTNMKMISFTDSQSATLPHFPTQQVGVPYPHCSTMPLPPIIPPPIIHPPCNYPRHTTIPSHHNGIRLFTPNIYGKRAIVNRYPQHHSFPQLMSPLKFNLKHISERDSANFSMASSGDGETYRS
ncbi:protein tincar [Halyomorpha halys]|uniref:protein tincar n=1 Tax=Halyomorpha halys TaxID=286706 RepID=UPI0006D4FAD1|nr:protein tincar [Halyomorpha halys]